jgi:RNA polymerase sigma factor (sigma-70 family)
MTPFGRSDPGRPDSRTQAVFEQRLGLPLPQAIELVYVVALRLTGNRHDAWDLAQDVCEKVLRRLEDETLTPIEGSPRAWLTQVTKTSFIANWRRTRALKRGGGALDLPLEETLRRADRDEASEPALRKEMQRAVRSAVAELPPKQRAVIDLVLLGYSLAEIARKLDIQVGTVKSRSHAARRRLRGELRQARSPVGEHRWWGTHGKDNGGSSGRRS